MTTIGIYNYNFFKQSLCIASFSNEGYKKEKSTTDCCMGPLFFWGGMAGGGGGGEMILRNYHSYLVNHQPHKIILLGIISIVCIARTSGKTDGTV